MEELSDDEREMKEGELIDSIRNISTCIWRVRAKSTQQRCDLMRAADSASFSINILGRFLPIFLLCIQNNRLERFLSIVYNLFSEISS